MILKSIIRMKSTIDFFPVIKVGDKSLDMKYHVLHDFITSTPFEEKSSDHFKDLQKMEILTNFDISL